MQRTLLSRFGAGQVGQRDCPRAGRGGDSTARGIYGHHRDTAGWWTETKLGLANRLGHKVHPAGQRRLSAGQANRFGLIKTDPYATYELSRVADKIGVAIIVGRPGLPG